MARCCCNYLIAFFLGSLYTGAGLDSARQNLAAAFVNGFLNCGFGTDKMFAEDGNKWIYKNKEHGMYH